MTRLRSTLHDVRQAIHRALGTPYVVSFLAIGFALGWLPDVVLRALAWLGLSEGQQVLAEVGLVVVVLTLGVVAGSRTWASITAPLLPSRTPSGVHDGPAAPAKWLVTAASPPRPGLEPPEALPVRFHLAHGQLERVVLLCSDDLMGVEAERAARALLPAGLAVEVVRYSARGLDDPEAVFEAVEGVYAVADAEGVSAGEVVLFTTAGTSAFTAGMVLAGATPERRLQHARPARRLPGGRPDTTRGFELREWDLRFDISSHLAPLG